MFLYNDFLKRSMKLADQASAKQSFLNLFFADNTDPFLWGWGGIFLLFMLCVFCGEGWFVVVFVLRSGIYLFVCLFVFFKNAVHLHISS